MATYTSYQDLAESPLFAQFVKETLGCEVKDVSVLDQNALFYSFKLRVNDLSDEERQIVNGIFNNEPNEEIKKYAQDKLGKQFNELSDEEKVFATFSLYAHKQAENQNDNNQDEIGIGGSDNENDHKHENDDNNNDNGNQQPSNDDTRIRSFNSDTNDDMLYDVRLQILQSRGMLKDLKPEDVDTREKVINVVNDKLQKMSEDDRKSVEYEIYAKMINNEVLFAIMPPKKLAEAYDSYDERLEKTEDEQEKSALLAEKEKVGKRIDELTDMLVNDSHHTNDLFFMDNTNVADVYKGYMAMFSARSKGLQENDARLNKMQQGQSALDKQYNEYINTWNLQDVTPDKAKDLNKRFEQLDKGLKKVVLDDEIAKTVVSDNGATLGQLLSNFKYLDKDGNIEPQFIDKDGNKSDVYTPGAKVLEGSKLEQNITLAKQLFIQHNIGTNEELTPEMMKTAITEYLPSVMYITHVKSNVEKGLAENVQQFNDPKYLKEFKDSLGQTDKPMQISHNSFEQAKQSLINDAYSFRDVLADKITDKDNPKDAPENKAITHNLCRNIIAIDPRRDMRYTKRVTENAWGNYASEVLQGTVAAAVGTARIKGAMILTSAVASASTGIAAGTVMLGASAVLPVALSIKQYISCRNELKKSGKPCGFKDVFKNKNFLASLGTTALTEAAIGCAFAPVPGARVAAVALGAAAITIGITRAAVNDYKKLRAAGKSKWKALGAAIFGGAIKAGVAYLVGQEMNAMAQDAGMLSETVKVKDGQEEISHMEWHYDADVAAKAHHTLESFYGHDDAALNHDLDQVREQLKLLGREDIPPEVFLRNAVDAGMNTGVDTINHVQGGPDVHTHGNNTVLTRGWAAEHNINYDDVRNLADIKDADGNIHIDENALKGFDNTKHMINTNNTVGHTSNTEHQDDGVNKNMASVDKNGRVVTDNENPDRYKTYADGNNGLHQEKIIDQEKTDPVYETREVDALDAYAMLGIRNGGWKHVLANRAGSLLDRTESTQTDNSKPRNQQDTPPSQGDIKPLPTDELKPVEGDQPIVVPPPADNELKPVEGDRPVIKPIITPTPAETQDDLLLKEYKLVYGTSRGKKSALAEYKKLVLDEYRRATENGETKAADFHGYLEERMETFKGQLTETLGVKNLEDASKNDVNKAVNEARNMAKSARMGSYEGDGGHIKTNDMTLLSLGRMLSPLPVRDNSKTNTVRRTASHEK